MCCSWRIGECGTAARRAVAGAAAALRQGSEGEGRLERLDSRGLLVGLGGLGIRARSAGLEALCLGQRKQTCLVTSGR